MKYIEFLILTFFFSSCTHTDVDRNRFNKELKFFKDDFVNHFPDISDGIFTTYISKNGTYEVTEVFLLNKYNRDNYNKNDFKRKYDSLKKVSKTLYKASDTCLLVVNMFTTELNIADNTKASSKELEILNDECLSNKLPIPNFWALKLNYTTRCKLPENFELLVLEAKSGIYWDKQYITDGQYMPKKWKHGYSKGIAINKKKLEIIYWFVIW